MELSGMLLVLVLVHLSVIVDGKGTESHKSGIYYI